MMFFRNIKFTKQTAKITLGLGTFRTRSKYDSSKMMRVLALSLLLGNYNPLRQYCKNNQPIDLEKLEGFKAEFDDLISRVRGSMNTDIRGMLYHIREND